MPYINSIDIAGFLLFVYIIIVDIITLLSGHTGLMILTVALATLSTSDF